MLTIAFAYYQTNDAVAAEVTAQLLTEGKPIELGQGWSVRVDRSIANIEMTHNHVQFKGRDVAIINRDSTPSHGTDPNQLPNWVLKDMKKLGLTESRALMESVVDRVPEEKIELAIELEELRHRALS